MGLLLRILQVNCIPPSLVNIILLSNINLLLRVSIVCDGFFALADVGHVLSLGMDTLVIALTQLGSMISVFWARIARNSELTLRGLGHHALVIAHNEK